MYPCDQEILRTKFTLRKQMVWHRLGDLGCSHSPRHMDILFNLCSSQQFILKQGRPTRGGLPIQKSSEIGQESDETRDNTKMSDGLRIEVCTNYLKEVFCCHSRNGHRMANLLLFQKKLKIQAFCNILLFFKTLHRGWGFSSVMEDYAQHA